MINPQTTFFDAINNYPFLSHFWDQDNRLLDIEGLESALGIMSTGEQHIARFFAGIWLHKNKYDFDAIEAAKSLDHKSLQIIHEWMTAPEWP